MAYHAVRNFVSVFDNLDKVCDMSGIDIVAPAYNTLTKTLYYLFEDNETALQSLVLWQGGNVPVHCDWRDCAEIIVENFNCKEPVCIDILNGTVYEIPYRKFGKRFKFSRVPIYDSPMLVCDKSLVEVLPLK